MLSTDTRTFTLRAVHLSSTLQLFNSSTCVHLWLPETVETVSCTASHLWKDATGTLVSLYKETVQRNPPVREVFSAITLECFVKCNSTLAKSRIRDGLCILSSE